MNCTPFYTHTCQCKYWREGKWHYGILYHSMLIDAETGNVYWTDDIYEAAKDIKEECIIEYDWLDLTSNLIIENNSPISKINYKI